MFLLLLMNVVYLTWNGNIATIPLLIYHDEMTYDAENPLKYGLVCRSGNASLYPAWYSPDGTGVGASFWPNLRGVPVRFYQFFNRGTSRLIFKQFAYVRETEISGLFTCRLRGHQPVAVGIYRRSFSGKVASVYA